MWWRQVAATGRSSSLRKPQTEECLFLLPCLKNRGSRRSSGFITVDTQLKVFTMFYMSLGSVSLLIT